MALAKANTMSLSRNDYSILVRQGFQCAGAPRYTCPLGGQFDGQFGGQFNATGYFIFDGVARCPACHTMRRNQYYSPANTRIIAKQRIIHFLLHKQWTIGNGGIFHIKFDDFWRAFYEWSEAQKLYTKKKTVRSVIMEMCCTGSPHSMLPISPLCSCP